MHASPKDHQARLCPGQRVRFVKQARNATDKAGFAPGDLLEIESVRPDGSVVAFDVTDSTKRDHVFPEEVERP
jgi:hypothetical protein